VTDRQIDGQNCDGQDVLKAVAAFAHKNCWGYTISGGVCIARLGHSPVRVKI